MSEELREALVVGIGNVLWADEGFGVRAVEALNDAFEFGTGVQLLDGGTLGLNLLGEVEYARRVLVFDAVDTGAPPGTLVVLRGSEVPAWGARKLSPHQNGFNDVLALARVHARYPRDLTAIGVQPAVLDDFGGSLSPAIRECLPRALELAVQEMARWGLHARRRQPGEPPAPLNASSLQLAAYESGRPSSADACRVGDARLLAARNGAENR